MRFFLALIAALFIGAHAQSTDNTTPAVHEHTHGSTQAHDATTPSPSDAHLGRQVAELLVMRAENIIHRAEAQIAEIVKLGGENLVFSLKNEVALAEQMVTGVRHELADMKHMDIHKLHQIEEALLHIENRLADELRVIDEVKKHPEQHIKVEELIAQAEKLEKEAKDVLHKFGEHTDNKIANAIHNELHAMEELTTELKKHPKGSELIKEAIQMAKHELSLRGLLMKAEEELRHHHHNN